MGKAATPRALPENEAKAVARMLRVSPQKLNLVAQLIRGKKVATALADLEFSRKRIAREVQQVPRERHRQRREQPRSRRRRSRRQAEAHVGKALVLKRFHARARGRGARILKPFSNLTIVVREVAEQEA